MHLEKNAGAHVSFTTDRHHGNYHLGTQNSSSRDITWGHTPTSASNHLGRETQNNEYSRTADLATDWLVHMQPKL